jgi:hypothetical protein
MLNEEQYRALCSTCDRLLMTPDVVRARIANPWLHIIREHPAFLVQYEDLFCPENGKVKGRFFLQFLRHMAAGVRQAARAFRFDGSPWRSSGALPDRIDILFVSHLINESHIGQAADFYFGQLPQELAVRGYAVAIALIDQTRTSTKPSLDQWIGNSVPRLLLSTTLGVADERRIHHEMRTDASRLRAMARRESDSLSRKVQKRAAQEATSNGTRTALRLGRQMEDMVRRFQPQAIVTTYEGHAWERVVFASARRAAPDVKCVGYQHAALFRLQHAIRRKLFRGYDPDHILTPGQVSKRQFEDTPSLAKMPVSVLGSNRSFGDSGRQPGRSDGPPACLVIPEGLVDECQVLFDFSLACALSDPGTTFIWRLHPILTFDALASRNATLKTLPSNVIMSRSSLTDDLARCHWALYRGTTAVIQAVMAGLHPVYLARTGEMTIDPLYEVGELRSEVSTVADFLRLRQAYSRQMAEKTRHQEMELKEYCRGFYTPLNADTISRVIHPRSTPSGSEMQ